MAAPRPDFDDLKRNLLRALTGNVEQVVGAFVEQAAVKFETAEAAAEALEARADIRARQVDEARVDAASYFDQEVARLEARFGAVESDVSPVVSDDPLIRLQSASKLKGSVGEGPNQTNYSDRSSVRILGIQRKPRKGTSSK